ncbi:DUF1850 domain-containing protein [Methylibium sp.]|uniref:DUF1850 domain-containing protein n=1 Tax=Methylibium sp. TaxID=2067992 RepID=UPI00183951F6|nr:DUF1850 domain-containing protein [Methylibium sp.]MBA3589261.1 DUF1850 domain-containing protein [Methylibium sp.]
MSVLGVCLALAAASAEVVFVPAQRFTLAWTHSIEKTRWEEDYKVDLHAGTPRLRALSARVRGSGAGMEPPPDAVLRKGWYEYQAGQPLPPLRLTRSAFTPDYDWCDATGCRPLAAWLPSDGGVTLLHACRDPAAR